MKKLILVSIAVAVLVSGFSVWLSGARQAGASVSIGGEYQATSTRLTNGTAITNLTVIQSGPGALGSVVITGAGAGVINLYDATSTVTNTDWATTTLVTIPASAAAGTYTFDAIFRKGLLIETTGTTPTSTITYR